MSKMLKDTRQVPFHPGIPMTFVGPVASVPTEVHKPCVLMVSCLRSCLIKQVVLPYLIKVSSQCLGGQILVFLAVL